MIYVQGEISFFCGFGLSAAVVKFSKSTTRGYALAPTCYFMLCFFSYGEGSLSNNMEKFSLPVGKRMIHGVLHLSAAVSPVIICCHGLFSSKGSDKFLEIADAFTREGFSVVRFDFGGCGESTGDIADTTVSSRLQDLEAVRRHIQGECGLKGRHGILGSSLGGYVGLLHAAKNPVAALSVWSTPCDLLSITRNIPKGDLQKLKQDFFSDARGYDLLTAVAAVKAVQVLHGTSDEVVPVEQAGRIYEGVQNPKEYLLLPGADHSLSQLSFRQQAITSSLAWYKKQMLAGQ
jgi:uncharacterized protein